MVIHSEKNASFALLFGCLFALLFADAPFRALAFLLLLLVIFHNKSATIATLSVDFYIGCAKGALGQVGVAFR